MDIGSLWVFHHGGHDQVRFENSIEVGSVEKRCIPSDPHVNDSQRVPRAMAWSTSSARTTYILFLLLFLLLLLFLIFIFILVDDDTCHLVSVVTSHITRYS